MKIKTVFVDLGGVLVLNRSREIGDYFEKKYNLKAETTKNIFRYIQSGEKDDEGLNKLLMKLKVCPDVWEKYVSQFIDSEAPNDQLVKILTNAKKKGVKIIYTSNNSNLLLKILEKYKLLDLPDAIVNSSLLKICKPDKSFWKYAFEESKKLKRDILKSEILVIDDSPINIKSAFEYGFETVLYNTSTVNAHIKNILLP